MCPKVLSLSCTYPNPTEPGLGVFVQRRLQQLAGLTQLEVVAPFAILKYGNPRGKRIRISEQRCPIVRRDGAVEVQHPRWFYPPFCGVLTAFCLFSQMIFPLMRIRKRFQFNVIDTHFGYPDGVAGCFLSLALGVPFTMTFRGNEVARGSGWLARKCMQLAARRAHRVFTLSQPLRQFAITLGATSERIKVIPNGIDASVFFPRNRPECRAKYEFADDRPVILSAGALVERKGHNRIIEAVKYLSNQGIPTQLVIAGGPGPEGDCQNEIRRLVSDLDLQASVRFTGAVAPEMMAEIMSAADVLCLASTREGWPNVVHEALACGTPVVTTDVGAVRDMLPTERYGLVVPINDPTALQRALRDALRTDWDRTEISAWGMSRSWRQVALEVLEEMQHVIEETEVRKS